MTLFRSNLLSKSIGHAIDFRSRLWTCSTLEVLATTAVAAALLALLFV